MFSWVIYNSYIGEKAKTNRLMRTKVQYSISKNRNSESTSLLKWENILQSISVLIKLTFYRKCWNVQNQTDSILWFFYQIHCSHKFKKITIKEFHFIKNMFLAATFSLNSYSKEQARNIRSLLLGKEICPFLVRILKFGSSLKSKLL